MKNVYTFIFDVGMGVEEFYTRTEMAPDLEIAIQQVISSASLDEYEPDEFFAESLFESLDKVIETFPATGTTNIYHQSEYTTKGWVENEELKKYFI